MIKREGVKLVDVAKMLSLSHKTLHKWYKHGKIRATKVWDGRDEYLVIPNDEVDKLKKCERKTDRR
jgi:predicted site-specific integrase-resolvase